MNDTTTRLREMLIVCHERGTHGIVDVEAVQDAIAEIERLRAALIVRCNFVQPCGNCEACKRAEEALK